MTEPTPPSDPLQFDKAEFEAPPPGAAAAGPAVGPLCTFCGKQLRSYYAIADKLACASCHAQVLFALEGGSGAERFAKAALLGLGAAGAGALLWWGVMTITGAYLGIAAIVVGWIVGAAVRRGSDGRGGWVYQLLAIALTYVGISLAHVPQVAKTFQWIADHPPESGDPAQIKPPSLEQVAAVKPSAAAWALAVPFAFAAPAVMGMEQPILLIILGFALFEAWRSTARVVVPITGPHEVGTGPPPPPSSTPPPAQAPAA